MPGREPGGLDRREPGDLGGRQALPGRGVKARETPVGTGVAPPPCHSPRVSAPPTYLNKKHVTLVSSCFFVSFSWSYFCYKYKAPDVDFLVSARLCTTSYVTLHVVSAYTLSYISLILLLTELFSHAKNTVLYTVADPETLERGPRNMKYKSPHSAAIFLGLFLLGRGGLAPPPPGSATDFM